VLNCFENWNGFGVGIVSLLLLIYKERNGCSCVRISVFSFSFMYYLPDSYATWCGRDVSSDHITFLILSLMPLVLRA
jgi:hypothetical protein